MKTKIFNLLSVGIVALTLVACSDSFLEDKKNYDNVGVEVYDDYDGADLRVISIYGQCLPDANTAAAWNNNCTGLSGDAQTKSTEEISGFSIFVDPQNEMSAIVGTIVPDYFQNEQKHLSNVWGRIRNINDAIKGISDGKLSNEEKSELLGQCYFFRAWCYYQLVKWYGGVPIITTVQETSADSYTPRSSAEECIKFIISDLDKAAEEMEASTMTGSLSSTRWGRVTTGTALALKGRVLALWCSPMFNRTGSQARYQEAYATMKEDLPKIDACGYGLYQTGSNKNGSDFASVFSQEMSKEAVFVVLYNNIDASANEGKNNGWERSIRPANTQPNGGAGVQPSAMLIDMFPMADGKLPAAVTETYTKLEKSTFAYDRNYPFVDRDPRFYRTFAFPGVRWAYDGDASNGGKNNNPSDGKNYALWNYRWYTNKNDAGNVESGEAYGADNLLSNAKGMYLRKRSDDLDLGSALYSYDTNLNQGPFCRSRAPYIEIRYAEVLLNLAEVACGAGETGEAANYLQMVRDRAGVPAYTDLSDQATCMSAILYERQIELAYEGKRFDDMRRWMLYDGGAVKVDGAPDTWTLTGWGGNTCTWLGFKPFNGQRRENMEFRVADKYGVGGKTYDSDPLLNIERCAPMDLRENLEDQQNVLKAWYTTYLVRKDNKGDARDANHVDLYIQFYPKYYFLGFSVGAMNRNSPLLEQTIGWENSNNGGAPGTFDPLAE